MLGTHGHDVMAYPLAFVDVMFIYKNMKISATKQVSNDLWNFLNPNLFAFSQKFWMLKYKRGFKSSVYWWIL